MTVDQCADLAVGYWIHQHDAAASPSEAPGNCLVAGCGGELKGRRLCAAHLGRFHHRLPAIPRPTLVRLRRRREVLACERCGATWCELTPARHKTCRGRGCLGPAPKTTNAERDAAILERVRAGDTYGAIAVDFGLSEPRITQLANRAGLYRRDPRGPAQRAARRRNTAPQPSRPTSR